MFVDDEPYINYHIAHIRDARPGNRYESSMSDDDRRAFTNLILLCKPHHELVDKRHPERFSVEELTRWKVERERDIAQPLTELRDLAPADLEELLRHSVQVEIQGPSSIDLGGKGGGPLGGGGGGGVLGGGVGGPGGPGGKIVLLDGSHGTVPGGGGGGGGAVDERLVKRTFQCEGRNYAEIDPEGGGSGPSAAARQDEELGPALAIVAAMYADCIHVRDGLVYMVGGGWEFIRLPAVPFRLTAGFLTLIDARSRASRTTELLFQVKDPPGSVRQEARQIVNLTDRPDPRRASLLFTIDVEGATPGIWRVVISSGAVEIADVPLRIDGPEAAAGQLSQPAP